MQYINLPSGSHTHTCDSYRDGDWIVYTCPRCDYELRKQWRTGKLIVRNAKVNIRHRGTYFPTEYKDAFMNLN